MPSFDIVSKTDLAEVDNALGNIAREIETRFDFKGSKCAIARVYSPERRTNLPRADSILPSESACPVDFNSASASSSRRRASRRCPR